MKSRRLTVFCIAIMALVGTPRAWQEVSKLLAAAQHKAQVKFWSMVLEPGERESASSELVAAADLSAQQPAELASDCAFEHRATRNNLASVKVKAVRRENSASSQPKARTQKQESDGAPTSHADLIARAPKSEGENSSSEHLQYFRSAPPSPPSSSARSLPAPTASKGDNLRFVLIPVTDPAAMALFEKEKVVELKMLRKTFEDTKLIRQKSRLPVSRGAAILPAS
jgi:hypothetical protein